MSVTRIATRYAKSLMELAQEQGKLTQVSADVITLSEAVRNRDLYLMLKSPIIHGDKKIAVLEAIFKGKFDVLTMAYLELLVNKGREAYLPEISAEFASQYKAFRKITSITVITAAEMSDAVLAELKAKLIASDVTSDNLEIVTQVDPELIGGFVLQFDNKRYDASIAHKLDELRSAFSKNLYIKEF
jgi:F-type H+-transporting ATPase subunit delta